MHVINPGSTLMLKINLNNILIDTVDSIQFYLSRTKDNNPTITKTYKKDGSDEVQLNNGYFYVPYTQEDTLNFLGIKMVYFGIQINFTNKSVSKIDYDIFFVQETIGTEIIENNIPSIDTTESYIEADFDVVYVLNISKEELQSYVESSKINADTAVAAKNDAVTAKDTAVEQANSASLNKDKTDTNVTTTKQLAEQVGEDKTEVSEMVTESRALLEEQRKLIGLMPTIYIVQTIDEMRAIANPKEKDICFVLGEVQSAYMYYTTAIDGTALSNPTWVWLTDIQLVAPSKDYLLNILQLATVATTGSYTDLINKPKRYESFVIVDDGVWDYSAADKIKLTADLVSIGNVYNGAVGLIQTDLDITLPENSKKAYDYDYMDLPTGGMYQYTFLYDGSYYNWSRMVIV